MSFRYSFRPIRLEGGGAINMVARSPADGTLVVAGDIEGIYRSEDSADHWRSGSRGLYSDFLNRTAFVAWSTTETNTVYAGMGNEGSGGGFLASTDGGKSWTVRSTAVQFSGNNNNNTAALPSSHPRSTGNLLAQGGGFTYVATFNGGVFRSADNGSTWTNIGLSGGTHYARSLVIDPSNTDVLYVSMYNEKVWKCTNASAGSPSWTQLTNAPAIVEELRFVGTYVYAASGSSGVYRSTDGGSTWDSLNGAFIDTTQSLWMSIDGYVNGSSHVVIAGCANAVVPSGDGARNLVKLTIDSGGTVTYGDLTTTKASFSNSIPPDNRTWWRATAPTNYYDWITGKDWNPTYILIDPTNTNRIWVAGSEGIARSTDGGATWRPAIDGMALTSCRRVLADPNHPPTIWIPNTDWTVMEVTDGIAQDASTTISHAPTSAGVGYAITLDPSDSRVAMGVGNRDTNTEGQVFSKPYGGSYWIDEGLQDVGTLTAAAADSFNRTVSSSWGTADTGGTWTRTNGNATDFNVNGSVASVQLPANSGSRGQFLQSVSAQDVTGYVEVTWDRLPVGSVHFTSFYVRSTDGTIGNGYTFRIEQAVTTGVTTIRFHRIVASTTQQIGSPLDLSTNYVPGQTMSIRFKATGTNPTNLYMKAWVGGADSEPTDWMITTTDSNATLQTAGSVGIRTSGNTGYTGGALFTYDNFSVSSIAAGSGDPGNKRPVGLVYGRDASNNRVLLAAVDTSGLWRKASGTWTKVSTSICAGAQSSRYAEFVWQSGSQYVYVLDRASGLYRSDDYGVTWTQIWSLSTDSNRVGYIAQNAAAPTELWVSKNDGLYKLSGIQSGTVGSGITSTLITAVTTPGPLYITSQGHIFCVSSPTSSSATQLLRSVDSGVTWTDVSDESYKAAANRSSFIAVDTRGHVYVTTQNSGTLIGYSVGQSQTT